MWNSKFIPNFVVLAAIVGFVLTGWLIGHILRYSTPALWHPPIQETDPHLKNGFDLEWEDEFILLTPPVDPWTRVYIGEVRLEPAGASVRFGLETKTLPEMGRAEEKKV
jgi:hypothetical protein